MIHYATGDPGRLLEQLGGAETAKILDVGGGAKPFRFARVVVDYDFSHGNAHRDGTSTPMHKKGVAYVRADIQHLPFRDNAFDLVICLHVLEHVMSPGKACDELMRVAEKGFLETPRKWSDYFAGHPTHHWLVDTPGGRLTFEPIAYNDSPFMSFVLPPLWGSDALRKRVFFEYPGIPCVQLAWEGSFDYEVRGALPEDVTAPARMAERHYCFALNLLHWMTDFRAGLFHIKTARRLMPDMEKYQRLERFYTLLTGGFGDIIRTGPGVKSLFTAMGYRFIRFFYTRMLKRFRETISGL